MIVSGLFLRGTSKQKGIPALKLARTLAAKSALFLLVFALVGATILQDLNTLLTINPELRCWRYVELRDGRILVHEEQGGNSRNWHILTPDASGSYINGTWSSGGSMQSGYAPWFFGSQVLLDGKTIVVEGGEYNSGSSVWTTDTVRSEQFLQSAL